MDKVIVGIGLGLLAGVLGAGCSSNSQVASTTQSLVQGGTYTTFVTPEACDPGSDNGINCNHYRCQEDVYLTGGPNRTRGGNTLEDGTYYFAVIEPGAQNGGAADGAEGNLSSSFDTFADRTFTMTGGDLSYSGPHPTGTTPNGQLAVGAFPFSATGNPGGVYILAICRIDPQTGPSADPSECKFDAFHANLCAPPPPVCDAAAPPDVPDEPDAPYVSDAPEEPDGGTW